MFGTSVGFRVVRDVWGIRRGERGEQVGYITRFLM